MAVEWHKLCTKPVFWEQLNKDDTGEDHAGTSSVGRWSLVRRFDDGALQIQLIITVGSGYRLSD